MSKLLTLKEWLTLEEASHYLTVMLGEKVKAKDIYRLALENKITLSLLFINHSYVELTNQQITYQQSSEPIISTGQYKKVQAGACYDLVNQYTTKLILKQHYFNDLSIPITIEPQHTQGIFCLLPDGLNYGRLIIFQKSNRQLSQIAIAPSLPADINLVIKTPYLLDFVNNITCKFTLIKDLHPEERISLYKIIALLTSMNQLAISQQHKIANIIKTHGENIGIEQCPNRDTIAKYLKEASYYLPD